MRFPPGEMFGSLDKSWLFLLFLHFRTGSPPPSPPLSAPFVRESVVAVSFAPPPTVRTVAGEIASLESGGGASIRNSGLISPFFPPFSSPGGGELI